MFVIVVTKCKKPKPIVPNGALLNPIKCFNRELKLRNELRGDFWVFYNYIPARGRYK